MTTSERLERIEVLYSNHQWMVQRDGDKVFLVERLAGYPDDLDGGFWVSGQELAAFERDGYTELHHIAEKNWVDMDALEPAARRAIALSGASLTYDFDAAIADARRYHDAAMGTVA